MKLTAFTLIELLVVIVIIGILATISVATLLGYQEKADIAAAQASLRSSINELLVLRVDYENGSLTATELMEKDLDVVDRAITLGRLRGEQTLMDITGNNCSDCVCRGHNFVDPISSQAQLCIDRWDLIVNDLATAADMDFTFMSVDPWGSPYLVDENEGETTPYCRRDTLSSAGPNRLYENGGNDDYRISLTFYDTALCGE